MIRCILLLFHHTQPSFLIHLSLLRRWIFFPSFYGRQSKCMTALWMYRRNTAYVFFHPLLSRWSAVWCQAECKPHVHKSESSISCQLMRRLWIIKLWRALTCNNGGGGVMVGLFACADIVVRLRERICSTDVLIGWIGSMLNFVYLFIYLSVLVCVCAREGECGCVLYTSTICPSNISEWGGYVWLHQKHTHTYQRKRTACNDNRISQIIV